MNLKGIASLVSLVGLIILLSACSSKMSRYVNEETGIIDETSISKAIKDLRDNDPRRRIYALRVLESQGQSASQALPHIKDLLENDQDTRVQTMAFRAYIKVRNDFSNNIEIPIRRENNENLEIIISPRYGKYFNGYKELYNMLRYGFLPIHFKIKNNSTSAIRIDFDEAALEYSITSDVFKTPVPINEVVMRFHSSVGKAVFGAIILPLTSATPSRRGRANARTAKYFKDTILQSELIPAFASREGDLIFPMTERVADVTRWKISFPIVEASNRNKYNIVHVYDGETTIEGASFDSPDVMVNNVSTVKPEEKTSVEERLANIKKWLEKGLISEADYQLKKKEILDEL